MNKMDELFFRRSLISCETAPESMHYVEILNYLNNNLNSRRFDALADDEYNKFLSRSGSFTPRHEALLSNGLRLLLHMDVQQPKALSQSKSLSNNAYEYLVEDMRLPRWAIETSSIVGPFFWFDVMGDVGDRYFQFVLRKSDSQHRGAPHGWEMTLSYSLKTHITSGYVRAADSSDLREAVKELVACAEPLAHPFLLPVLLLNRELCVNLESVQRRARTNLHIIESTLSGWSRDPEGIDSLPPEKAEINKIAAMLDDAKGHLASERPQTWREVLKNLKASLAQFWDELPLEDRALMKKLHSSIETRVRFIEARLFGIDSYAQDTAKRLAIQAGTLHNVLLERDARINLEIAADTYRFSEQSIKDSSAMKTIALMTVVFLPATFTSAFFSTSFMSFDQEGTSHLSSFNKIYWPITISLTVITVGAWWLFDASSRRETLKNPAGRAQRKDILNDKIITEINSITGTRLRSRATSSDLLQKKSKVSSDSLSRL